jgi:drug/metabolite transporter superfamily protein YnfA
MLAACCLTIVPTCSRRSTPLTHRSSGIVWHYYAALVGAAPMMLPVWVALLVQVAEVGRVYILHGEVWCKKNMTRSQCTVNSVSRLHSYRILCGLLTKVVK